MGRRWVIVAAVLTLGPALALGLDPAFQARLASSGKELNTVYQACLAKFVPNMKEQLRIAQRAWIVFDNKNEAAFAAIGKRRGMSEEDLDRVEIVETEARTEILRTYFIIPNEDLAALRRYLEQAEVELAAVYKQCIASLNKEDEQKLREVERAWIEYRDKDMRAQAGDPSGRAAVWTSVRLARRRSAQMRAFYLQPAASAPAPAFAAAGTPAPVMAFRGGVIGGNPNGTVTHTSAPAAPTPPPLDPAARAKLIEDFREGTQRALAKLEESGALHEAATLADVKELPGPLADGIDTLRDQAAALRKALERDEKTRRVPRGSPGGERADLLEEVRAFRPGRRRADGPYRTGDPARRCPDAGQPRSAEAALEVPGRRLAALQPPRRAGRATCPAREVRRRRGPHGRRDEGISGSLQNLSRPADRPDDQAAAGGQPGSMKKYFFGYLFVRIAKLLAVLTVLAGVGYALFKLEQASLSAQAASYQTSLPLRQSLSRLTETLRDARQLVAAFAEGNGGTAPAIQPVDFSGQSLRDNDDLARLAGGLDQADRQRQQLKETLVKRFEALLESIQAKLRAHAAEIAPAAPPTAGASTGVSAPAAATPRPTPVPTEEAETLYTGQMSNYDIQQRTTTLDRGKELLKVLESSAENPENRKTLTDSVAQLDALTHLLPAKAEAPAPSEPALPSNLSGRNSTAPAPPRRELNAEKVADQLARLRATVRQTMLTSWTVDGAYSQSAALAAEERGRCRLATLTVKGIWLAAFGQLGAALLVAVFAAFLVLVLADFMQTLLDTATNTGVVADSVKSQP